jgi:hypothetical protein
VPAGRTHDELLQRAKGKGGRLPSREEVIEDWP